MNRYLLASTLIWLLAAPWLLFPAVAPAVAAVALLLLLLARLGAYRWQGRFLHPTVLGGWLAVVLALAGVAFVLSPLPEVGLSKLTVMALGAFGYFLVQDWLHERSNRGQGGLSPFGKTRALVAVLALAGVAVAGIGLLVTEWPLAQQVVDLTPLYAVLGALPFPAGVHRNEVAGTLLLLLPFVLMGSDQLRLRLERRRSGRIVRWAPALFVGAVLLLTQSRAALLGVLVMAGVWWVWGRWRLRTVVLALAAPAGGVLLVFAFSGLTFADVSAWLTQVDAASKSGPSLSWLTRQEMWRAAGQILVDYPVVGAGLYTFEPVSRANYVFDVIGTELAFLHAHNLFLQAGASLGWPGLVATVGLWATALAGLWHAGRVPSAARSVAQRQQMAALFGASLAGFLAFSMLDVVSLGHRPGVLLWLVLAGGAGVVTPTEGTMAARLARFAPVLPLLLLLVLTFWLPRNLAALRLDRARLAGGPIPSAQTAAALAGDPRRLGLLAYVRGDDEAALVHWRQDPDAVAFLQNQALQANRARRLAEAIHLYSLALALDPTLARVYYWRGLAREAIGEEAAALADMEKAAHYAPGGDLDDAQQALIWFNWGRMLAEREAWAAAAAALQEALILDGTNPRIRQELDAVSRHIADE